MSDAGLKPKEYKSQIKPVWCPGCGHFAVLNAATKALAHLGKTREEVAVVSGIGCSSRAPAYLDSYGFHGIHGRALPLATGLKLARPDLNLEAGSHQKMVVERDRLVARMDAAGGQASRGASAPP